jgi:hypothetical protein
MTNINAIEKQKLIGSDSNFYVENVFKLSECINAKRINAESINTFQEALKNLNSIKIDISKDFLRLLNQTLNKNQIAIRLYYLIKRSKLNTEFEEKYFKTFSQNGKVLDKKVYHFFKIECR